MKSHDDLDQKQLRKLAKQPQIKEIMNVVRMQKLKKKVC